MRINKDFKLHKAVETDKKSKRNAIKGIMFDKKNSRLIATNGHILAITPVEECQKDVSCIIPAKAYSETIKTTNPTIETSKKKQNNIKINSINGDSNIYEAITEEKYPDYERVLPEDDKPVVELKFNAKLLYNLSQALGNDIVTLTLTNDTLDDYNGYLVAINAIKVTAQMQDSYGILMPWRFNK